MKVRNSLSALRTETAPLSIAVGFFDGVHRGHRRLIQAARERAAERAGEAWVLTFEPHPMRVLNPAAAPRLLSTYDHKLRLLERAGVAGCAVVPFTRALAELEPAAFIDTLVREAPTLTDMLVGRNWRFGRHRKGNTPLLGRLARRHGFTLTVVSPASHSSETISSTRIRAEVLGGNLREAARMLGRPFSVLGTVVHGNRLGRELGYPTANLDIGNEVLPPYGIYAAHALLDETLHDGVVSYGVRPTFHRDGQAAAVLELHLFDFSGDLYNRTIEVFFAAHVRDEMAFPSADLLRRQIADDVVRVRRLLDSKYRKETLYTHCRDII